MHGSSHNSSWNMTSTNSTDGWANATEVNTLQLAIGFLICVILTATNLLILTILLYKPQIRKNFRIEFILWLCLSDIVVGISGLLFLCNYIIKGLSTNTYYCSFMYHMIVAGVGQSLAHTFLICIDRHMAVVAKVRYKRFTKKYRYTVIFGTWFFLHGYIGTMSAIYMRVDSITYCSLDSYPNHRIFMTGANVLYLPLLILIPLLYMSTMITFKSRSKRTRTKPGVVISVINTPRGSSQNRLTLTERNSVRQNYEKQVMVTTGLIVVVLLLLSGPSIIVTGLEGFDIIRVRRSTRIFITMMTYCNSAINPILYAGRIRKIRQRITELVCPCKSTRVQHY